jgi:hypothetical protein
MTSYVFQRFRIFYPNTTSLKIYGELPILLYSRYDRFLFLSHNQRLTDLVIVLINNSDNITSQYHSPIMLRSNRPRIPGPSDRFNDRVKCVNPRSKHYGHTASVNGMGKTRLNVTFENGHVGQYIDWRDAELVSRPSELASTPVSPSSTPGNRSSTPVTRSSSEDANTDLDQLTSLMEHLAFTSATVISSNYADPQHMEDLLTQFDRAVRNNARNIASTRRATTNGTSPSPTNRP